MKPRKTCIYCREAIVSYSFHVRRQRACAKPECQKQRRRDYNQKYYRDNKSDWDYRWEKRKAWRQKKMRLYMRQYRKENPDYVKSNRGQQQKRDRKKMNLVNSVVQIPIHAEKLMRSHVLESSCKFKLIRILSEREGG